MSYKIGSLDVSKNLFMLDAAAERNFRTSNANTGYANLYNGESASGSITGTLTNFATNYGFVAKAGAVPAHYLFDGTNDYIDFGTLTDLSGIAHLTMMFNLELTTKSSTRYIVSYNNSATERLQFYVGNTTSTWVEIFNGASGTYVSAPTAQLFPVLNTKTHIAVVYDGTGATNADRVKFYSNGVLVTGLVFSGTIPSTLPTFSSSTKIGNTTTPISGKIYKAEFVLKSLSIEEVVWNYGLCSGAWGLIGTDLTGGEMSLADNKTGLYNPYNNILSVIAAADPRTSDANTGWMLAANGESAAADRVGTLTNMATGYGFVAESGAVPAHYLFDGINDHVNFGDITEVNSAKKITFSYSVNIDDTTAVQRTFFHKLKDTNNWLTIYTYTDERFLFQMNTSGTVTMGWLPSYLSIIPGQTDQEINWVFDGTGGANADRLKLYVDGVLQTLTFSGTIPAILPNMVTGNATVGRDSATTFKGKIYNFSLYSDSKTQNFIKDQFYSSDDEWQGTLIGTEPGTPDGTMVLSDEYVFLDAQMCWLEYVNFAVGVNPWQTGQVGDWRRQSTLGYVDETLLRWDTAQFDGEVVSDAYILAFSDAIGSQTNTATSRIYEQDKTASTAWNNGTDGPPEFDDFDTTTMWATQLSSLTMQAAGVYRYEGLADTVNDWINETLAEADGLIIDADYKALDWENELFNVKIAVKIITAVSDIYYKKFIGGM